MKIKVFKIGGGIVDNTEGIEDFARKFASVKGPKALIHGGGVMAGRLQENLGITPEKIDGRRVTDSRTLKIVTMVYAGWCNRHITALLQKNGCNAIGLSGADGLVMKAVKRPPVFMESAGRIVDFGYVGDIVPENVNAPFILKLMESGLVPVFCPITCDTDGNLLNTNADTVASAIGLSLVPMAEEVELTYCFEKNGVLLDKDDENSLIRTITPVSFETLKRQGNISEGMIPKIENAILALRGGVKKVVIKNSANIDNGIQTDIEND